MNSDEGEDEEDYTGLQWSVNVIVAPHRKKGHLVVATLLSLAVTISLIMLTSMIQTAARCSIFEASFPFDGAEREM